MQRRKKPQNLARIRVFGVGGGGRTAVNSMITAGIGGVEFVSVDTDHEDLQESKAPLRIQLGDRSSDAISTAGDPEKGKRAANASAGALHHTTRGCDLVFLVAGLGGGTGTGAAPIIAQAAKQHGALVIGLVTYPFLFEGKQRIAVAERGIRVLKSWTDTLIVIPNQRLLQLGNGTIGFHETYRLARDIWSQSIQGISELVNYSGLINVDFADVRTIMSTGGGAVIATGQGRGTQRARLAAERATRSELLGISIEGARGVLFNIAGGTDMSLLEVEDAAAIITERAHPNANVIFGAAVDSRLENEVRITVIATGFKLDTLRAPAELIGQLESWADPQE